MKRLKTLGPRLASVDMRSARPPPAPKFTEAFYSSAEWVALRGRIRAERGEVCERCHKSHDDEGRRLRIIADHRVERRDGGAELDPANIELLCSPCHNRKTARAKFARIAAAKAISGRG